MIDISNSVSIEPAAFSYAVTTASGKLGLVTVTGKHLQTAVDGILTQRDVRNIIDLVQGDEFAHPVSAEMPAVCILTPEQEIFLNVELKAVEPKSEPVDHTCEWATALMLDWEKNVLPDGRVVLTKGLGDGTTVSVTPAVFAPSVGGTAGLRVEVTGENLPMHRIWGQMLRMGVLHHLRTDVKYLQGKHSWLTDAVADIVVPLSVDEQLAGTCCLGVVSQMAASVEGAYALIKDAVRKEVQ